MPPPHCPQCPRSHNPIHGDGPTPCSIMVIGEAPARREVESLRHGGKGRVLIGDSGIEYTEQYLPLANLSRADVYTTNLVKCSLPGYANPGPDLAHCCSNYWLHRELAKVDPLIIVTLGATALHTLFPGHNMEMEHGLPFIASWGTWEGVVVPMYHPAAGIHSGRLMLPIQQDWRHFGTLLTSMDFDRVADQFPNPDYRECTDAWDVRQYMELAGGRPLAIDTEVETLASMIPYCLSFSHSPGTSRVIRASSTAALRELHAYILSTTGHLIYHNALFDPPVLADMGLTGVLNHKFHDTMMMAYLLGDSAQSLKVLAYRELGMVMEEFVDVAFGPSKEVAMMWLVDAIHALAPKPIGTRIPKTGKHKGQTVPVFAKGKTGNEQSLMLANRALTDCLDDDKSEMNPWDRYKGWDTDVQRRVANAAGSPMPPLSIVHVPWSSAMYYAARDADATIRLYPHLAVKSSHVGRITL